jgi:hypothetical protein
MRMTNYCRASRIFGTGIQQSLKTARWAVEEQRSDTGILRNHKT